MSLPRPRREGTENPAFLGMDVRKTSPAMLGQEGSIIPTKMAKGSAKAQNRSQRSARASAAKNLLRARES